MRTPVALFLLLVLHGTAVNAEDNQLTRSEKRAGWLLLFDGKTLDGWVTSDQQPSQRPVEQGSINPHKCGAYMMIHEKSGRTLYSGWTLKSVQAATAVCSFGLSHWTQRSEGL